MRQNHLFPSAFLPLAVAASALISAAGCAKRIPGDRYNRAVQAHGPDRNPVIVIPGVLGSKLTDADTGVRVWGAFERGAADPGTAQGVRLIALPMKLGVPLDQLTDAPSPPPRCPRNPSSSSSS